MRTTIAAGRSLRTGPSGPSGASGVALQVISGSNVKDNVGLNQYISVNVDGKATPPLTFTTLDGGAPIVFGPLARAGTVANLTCQIDSAFANATQSETIEVIDVVFSAVNSTLVSATPTGVTCTVTGTGTTVGVSAGLPYPVLPGHYLAVQYDARAGSPNPADKKWRYTFTY